MNFEFNAAHGRFTDIAYGGGVDIKLTKRITSAPSTSNSAVAQVAEQLAGPYGASVGVGLQNF